MRKKLYKLALKILISQFWAHPILSYLCLLYYWFKAIKNSYVSSWILFLKRAFSSMFKTRSNSNLIINQKLRTKEIRWKDKIGNLNYAGRYNLTKISLNTNKNVIRVFKGIRIRIMVTIIAFNLTQDDSYSHIHFCKLQVTQIAQFTRLKHLSIMKWPQKSPEDIMSKAIVVVEW